MSLLLFEGRRIAVFLTAVLVLASLAAHSLAAREPSAAAAAPGTSLTSWFRPDELPNAPFFTLGGVQFWTDERILDGWRIQRHALTGHCRVLDETDVRRAWGTDAACHRALNEAQASDNLAAPRGRVVVLLHGLLCGRCVMDPMARRLREAGYDVVNFGYASTQAPVADHAQALAKVVAELDDADEIYFVGHSLGNIVVRHYLADETDAAIGRRPDLRIRRIVMLGPPNQGSARAVSWSSNPAFPLTLGPSAMELATHWPKLAPRLATPECEFGVIAGGRGDSVGFNPVLAGDDDGTVTVEETRLDGARDFTIMPVPHFFLLMHPQAIDCTVSFLQCGRFDVGDDSQSDGETDADERVTPIPPAHSATLETPAPNADGTATRQP